MDAGRFAANMAELFIMLVVMFTVQAILNFSLSDTVETSKKADLISLSLRQVPSAENTADHLAYLYLEEAIDITGDAGQDPVLLSSRVNASGECEAYEQSSPNPSKDDFAQLLAERGIEYQRIELEGMQTEHMFLWDPSVAGKGLILRVGYRYCQLGISQSSLSVSPDWNLQQSTLDRPHPLVISVSRFTEHISTSTRVEYFHDDDFPDGAFGMGSFVPTEGISFMSSDCTVKIDGRAEMVKEIRLQLDDLL